MKQATQKWISQVAMFSLAISAGASFVSAGDFPDSPPVAPLQEGIKLPAPFTATLDNGLDVLVISNDEIPWVSVSWRLLAGAKYDGKSKPGLAALTAGMLREGTKNYTSDEFSEKIDFNAISLGGSAVYETTSVSASSLKEKVDIAVDMLAEAVRQPIFPEKDFGRVQKQRMQGIQISEQNGAYQAGRAINEWLYGDHFQARPSQGSRKTSSATT